MRPSLRIVAAGAKSGQRDHGTAWALYPDLIVTAFHVVGSTSARLWKHEDPLWPGCEYLLEGVSSASLEPLLYDPRADVAILRMPEPSRLDEQCFLVPSPIPPSPGDSWFAEGYPDLPGLRRERGVGLGGVVQRASADLDSNAFQLHVRQGTAATWEGMSGSAVRNHNDEVLGIITQTSKDVATAHAAPVEAVERLLRLRDGGALAGRVRELFRGAGDEEALAVDLADAMGWSVLGHSLDGLVRRAAMEGGDGWLDLLAKAEEQRRAALPGAEDLRREIRDASRDGASEAEVLQVLHAFMPDNPEEEAALVDRLGGVVPSPIVTNAVARMIERGWVERRRDGTLTLKPEGATRAARREHVLAVLRQLRGGARLSREELAGRLPRISPLAFGRALECAILVGWVERQPGGAVRGTNEGEQLLETADRGSRFLVGMGPWPS